MQVTPEAPARLRATRAACTRGSRQRLLRTRLAVCGMALVLALCGSHATQPKGECAHAPAHVRRSGVARGVRAYCRQGGPRTRRAVPAAPLAACLYTSGSSAPLRHRCCARVCVGGYWTPQLPSHARGVAPLPDPWNLTTLHAQWTPRTCESAITFAGRAVIGGGAGPNGQLLNDVWRSTTSGGALGVARASSAPHMPHPHTFQPCRHRPAQMTGVWCSRGRPMPQPRCGRLARATS